MFGAQSSGNLIADRRYAYALAAFEAHDWNAAIDVLEQTLALVPQFIPAFVMLARAKLALDPDLSSATRQYVDELLQKALRIDLSDQYGAQVILSLIERNPIKQALSPAFVAGLFDQYASRFEQHLTQDLQYCGPELLLKSLKDACALRDAALFFTHVVDVGCGTGLMGAALKPYAQTIIGCDLSEKMIIKAQEKNIYTHLDVREMHEYLSECAHASTDLIIAADVLVYVGDLSPFFELCQNIIKQDGLVAFTVQSAPETLLHQYALGSDQRYVHTRTYLDHVLAKHGFDILVCEESAVRTDRNKPVPSCTLVATRNHFIPH